VPVAAALVTGGFTAPTQGQEAATATPSPPAADSDGVKIHPEFPSHDPALVREIVGASHARLDRVRELVEASPALARAAWDWGFGDWETALGAASHMGRRDIAELLIAHGARPDLFTFAMLGHVEVVKACVEARPGIQRIPGPHGITLMQHARTANASEVIAFLDSVGGADERAMSLEMSEAEKDGYLGRYVFGRGDDEWFRVLRTRQGDLAIQRAERTSRVLNQVEERGFAPVGAADVRVRFEIVDGRAVSLTIHDPVPLVRAVRADQAGR